MKNIATERVPFVTPSVISQTFSLGEITYNILSVGIEHLSFTYCIRNKYVQESNRLQQIRVMPFFRSVSVPKNGFKDPDGTVYKCAAGELSFKLSPGFVVIEYMLPNEKTPHYEVYLEEEFYKRNGHIYIDNSDKIENPELETRLNLYSRKIVLAPSQRPDSSVPLDTFTELAGKLNKLLSEQEETHKANLLIDNEFDAKIKTFINECNNLASTAKKKNNLRLSSISTEIEEVKKAIKVAASKL